MIRARARRGRRKQGLVSAVAVIALVAGSMMGLRAIADAGENLQVIQMLTNGGGVDPPSGTEETDGDRCNHSYTDADWYTRDGVGSLLIDFRDRDFRNCDLSGAVLLLADFSGSDISGADLSGADVRYGFFNDARLIDADLSGALLTGVDFSGADLTGADLSGSTRIYASFANAITTGCTDCTPTVPGSSGPFQSEQTAQDVVIRDQLIVAQKALLDTYRCLFNIDAELIPGGCIEKGLAPPRVQPTPFTAIPTAKDIESRDRLIITQEALLNTYRCWFDIDTEVVPGGCPFDPALDPPIPELEPTPAQPDAPTADDRYTTNTTTDRWPIGE